MLTNHSYPLQWRHDECDSVSNHRRLDCLFNRLFRWRSKKTLKLRRTGLCEGNSPVAGEFPSQKASNAENVSVWWRLHANHILEIQCTYSMMIRIITVMSLDRYGNSNHPNLCLFNILFMLTTKTPFTLFFTYTFYNPLIILDSLHKGSVRRKCPYHDFIIPYN